MHYIYRGKKIMLILRKRQNEPELNGIWIAANKTKSPKPGTNEVTRICSPFSVKGEDLYGNWLLIKDDADELEEAAIKVCGLIVTWRPANWKN